MIEMVKRHNDLGNSLAGNNRLGLIDQRSRPRLTGGEFKQGQVIRKLEQDRVRSTAAAQEPYAFGYGSRIDDRSRRGGQRRRTYFRRSGQIRGHLVYRIHVDI